MRQRGIVIARLELITEPEERLRRLEERLDASPVPIEMEKLKNRNPACLADVCLTKQPSNLEFFHGHQDLIGRLVKCVRLW